MIKLCRGGVIRSAFRFRLAKCPKCPTDLNRRKRRVRSSLNSRQTANSSRYTYHDADTRYVVSFERQKTILQAILLDCDIATEEDRARVFDRSDANVSGPGKNTGSAARQSQGHRRRSCAAACHDSRNNSPSDRNGGLNLPFPERLIIIGRRPMKKTPANVPGHGPRAHAPG